MIHNRSKYIISVIIIVSCFIFCAASAFANEIIPYADPIFRSATVSISSSGSVTFRCTTKDIVSVIEVIDCAVYKKNSNGSWSKVSGALSTPTTKGYNTIGYTQTVTPDKAFSDGTYQVTATFSADGHTKPATSAEVTFN